MNWEGFANGIVGIFILFNIFFVIALIIGFVQWIKEDRRIRGWWLEYTFLEGSLTFLVIGVGVLDVLVLISYTGYLIGNWIL